MDYINKILEKKLSPKRLKHTLGVAKAAKELAIKYEADVDKTVKAALLHDICKCYSSEELDKKIIEYDLPKKYLGKPKLSHSNVGAEFVKRELGIEDEEIINAIRFHTTGRANMTKLDEIIYLSDMIEENRQYEGVDKLRDLAKSNLEVACHASLRDSIKFLEAEKANIDNDTILAMKWLDDKLNGGKNEQ
ncbi:MAG: bis(5'-nucleosyl)-tetraphosphatase (symmetrical) YqeK [Anaerovoracaceae bacterium]